MQNQLNNKILQLYLPNPMGCLGSKQNYNKYGQKTDNSKKQFFNPVNDTALNLILHRSIGALVIKNLQKTQFYGSGVLISQNIVLTIAQNVIQFMKSQKQNKNKIQNIDKNINFNQLKFYLGNQIFYQIESIKIPQKYYLEKNIQYNYAIIKLKQNINYNQFLPLYPACRQWIQNNQYKLHLYGYGYKPKYKLRDTINPQNQYSQYGSAQAINVKVNQQNIFKGLFQMNTFRGQLGCPLVQNDKIIGLNCSSGDKKQQKQARLITKDLIMGVKQWCKQLSVELVIEQTCPHCSKNKLLKDINEWKQRAISSFNRKQYEQSRQYYLRCLRQQSKLIDKDINEQAIILHQIGKIYDRQSIHEQAINYYNKQLQIYQSNNIKNINYIQNLRLIGHKYRLKKQYKQAIQYYKKCIQIIKQLNLDLSNYKHILINYAKCYKYINNKDQMWNIIIQYKLDSKQI